jgi:protein tyrosine/serine phosphatase
VVPIDINGVPNFYKVSEDLYRGAQPSAEGVKQLKQMGIKTIVNLRSVHSDSDEIGDIDIGREHIRFKPWNVETNEIEKFLDIVTDDTKVPVFVHCKYGADRTGFMCAVYRIAVCGWDKKAAINEMVNGGFGFHPVWKNIIESLNNLDDQKLRDRISDDNKLSIPKQSGL